MVHFLNAITHIIIVTGILGLFFFIGLSVHKEEKMFEKVILIISAMIGFLIYFSCRALGITIPNLMMSAIATTNPIKMGIIAIILPGALGIAVSWYFIWCVNKSIDIAFRILILISTFILTLFGDVYAATYSISKFGSINTSLLPNLTFTIGMGLYFILNYKHR